MLIAGLQDTLLARQHNPEPKPNLPGRHVLMIHDLGSVTEDPLMSARVQMTHLLLTPVTLTTQMLWQRVAIMTIDELV